MSRLKRRLMPKCRLSVDVANAFATDRQTDTRIKRRTSALLRAFFLLCGRGLTNDLHASQHIGLIVNHDCHRETDRQTYGIVLSISRVAFMSERGRAVKILATL